MEKSQSVTFSQFTQNQIQKLKDAFQYIDEDGDGVISQKDLRKILSDLSKQSDEMQLQEMIGTEKEGITFPEFVSIMGERIESLPEESELIEALKTFSKENEEMMIKVDELETYLASAGFKDKKELDKVLQHFVTKQVSGGQVFKGKKFLETIGEWFYWCF